MGFNYLQTDDRDDYFNQLGKNRANKNVIIDYTLLNANNEIIFDKVPMFKLRSYAKKTFLCEGKSAKHIWRKILTDNGYTVINNKT